MSEAIGGSGARMLQVQLGGRGLGAGSVLTPCVGASAIPGSLLSRYNQVRIDGWLCHFNLSVCTNFCSQSMPSPHASLACFHPRCRPFAAKIAAKSKYLDPAIRVRGTNHRDPAGVCGCRGSCVHLCVLPNHRSLWASCEAVAVGPAGEAASPPWISRAQPS